MPVGALDDLITALRVRGYEVLGPRVRDGAVMIAPLSAVADLASSVTGEQSPGRYRLASGGGTVFPSGVGPHTWRHHLHPREQRVLQARQGAGRLAFAAERPAPRRQAFLGVRPCDVAAIAILDRVLRAAPHPDPHYSALRCGAFIAAVNCTAATATCFCASMGTGPGVERGFDLALTEIGAGGEPRFVVEVGSEAGAELAAALRLAPAAGDEVRAAREAVDRAALGMARSLDAEVVARALARFPVSPVYERVAQRCLSCGCCTSVCPTCFCTTYLDTVALGGATAERWRRWDSCFTLGHSYIHGGPVRPSLAARYRQWIRHKLCTWRDQYGTPGCVGCGRCITWCPAGIDLTAVAREIAEAERPIGEAG